MRVTIAVDAYSNRPFQGQVLKIEPQGTVNQNVTMFPVLVRIPNTDGLLKPGMNAEVEVHVGSRQGVLAVPNSALRTTRDVGSAAEVLGMDAETVADQLAAQQRDRPEGARGTEMADAGDATGEKVTWRGQEITLPEGVDPEAARSAIKKLEGASDMPTAFQSLSADERRVMQQLRQAGGMGGPGGGGRPGAAEQGGQRRQTSATEAALLGGDYIVFALRDGMPTAVQIRTGLTDLDYSEVLSGLSEGDTVMVLPSASLLASQAEWQERIRNRAGGLPGVQRN
jgi:HlyD family secretion protein